jgi:hypothetical protein
MLTRPLSELCSRIFTGIPARNRGDLLGTLPVAVVGIRALTPDGGIDQNALERVILAGPPRPLQTAVSANDVLLSIRGNMPKCALVQGEFSEPTYASGNLVVLRPNVEMVDPGYLWTIMMRICRDAHHPLLTRATTQQLSIRIGSLHKLHLLVPKLSEQKNIGHTALALRDAILAERRALEAGEQTFNAFLAEMPAA